MPLTTEVRTGYITAYHAVDCSDEPAIRSFLANLQRAWLLQPDWAEGEDLKAADLGSEVSNRILSHIQQPPEDELAVTGEPDRGDAHTPFREALYQQWSHVFFNIANFLAETNCNTGLHGGPSHQPLEARFPETGEEGEMETVLEFSVDKHMLLGVAFVEPGIRVKIGIRDQNEDPEQLHEDSGAADATDEEGVSKKQEAEAESSDGCTIDASNAGPIYIGKSIYWIKASHMVSIQVPRQAAKAGKLACVFVASPYSENFFPCNNEEHMRLHELYDDGGDRAGDLKGSMFTCAGGAPASGEWRTEDDLCAEVNSIALMLHEKARKQLKQQSDEQQAE